MQGLAFFPQILGSRYIFSEVACGESGALVFGSR
jgi:hypothetical protein